MQRITFSINATRQQHHAFIQFAQSMQLVGSLHFQQGEIHADLQGKPKAIAHFIRYCNVDNVQHIIQLRNIQTLLTQIV